jgi:hypothetical protein
MWQQESRARIGDRWAKRKRATKAKQTVPFARYLLNFGLLTLTMGAVFFIVHNCDVIHPPQSGYAMDSLLASKVYKSEHAGPPKNINVRRKDTKSVQLSLNHSQDTHSGVASPAPPISPAVDWGDHILLKYLRQRVPDARGLVYLRRFYTEKNISLGIDTNGDGFLDSISTGSTRVDIASASAPVLAWARPTREANIFHAKKKFLHTIAQLGLSMKALSGEAVAKGVSLSSVRYHTYLGHCYLLKLAGSLEDLPLPVILTTKLDENWGYLTSDVWPKTCQRTGTYDHKNNRCTEEYQLATSLKKQCGKTYTDFKRMLDHPKIALMVVSQHQSFNHPKVVSLPLGARNASAFMIERVVASFSAVADSAAITKDQQALLRKPKLVLINNSGWWYRARVNRYFAAVFNESNTYSLGKFAVKTKRRRGDELHTDYLRQMMAAKFVICPPGLGYDTFRMWEALAMGAIPVVESSAGLDRNLFLLPVLIVEDLIKLNPSFLEKVYPCFIRHAHQWHFEMLSQAFWDGLLATTLATGQPPLFPSESQGQYLTRNPHCWFFEESKMLKPQVLV